MAVYTEEINLDGNAEEKASGIGDAIAGAASGAAGAAKAIASLAAAFVAGTAAMVAGAVSLALSANDAKGDMALLFDTLGDGALTGQEAIDMFDRLGESTGQTRAQLAKTGQAFAAMGVTGIDQLERLTLAATHAGLMAEGGGKAFEAMWTKVNSAVSTGQALKIPLKGLGSLASMGLKVDDVAKAMGVSSEKLGKQLKDGSVDAKKFGDALQTALVEKGANIAADAAVDLGNMWARAKENFAKFFEDVDTGPFLKELKSMFAILDQANPSGKALKAGIGGALTKIFSVMTSLVPMVKHFFLDMIIYGLKAYLAIKPVVAAIQAFAESEDGIAAINMVKDSLLGAAIAAGVVIGILVYTGAVIVGVIAVAVGAFAALSIALNMAYQQLLAWGISATVAAQNFIDGLIGGITAGAAKVVSAVKGLADGASAAFKSALGIASPSKVMLEAGVNMGDGVAVGVDASSATVAGSMTDLATTAEESFAPEVTAKADAPAPTMPTMTSGKKSGGMVINVEPGAIVINGADGTSTELVETAVALMFERIAVMQGVEA